MGGGDAGRGEGEGSEEVRAERGTAWHLRWGALYSQGGPSSRQLLHSGRPSPTEAPRTPGLLQPPTSSWVAILCFLQIMTELMAHVSPRLPVDLALSQGHPSEWVGWGGAGGTWRGACLLPLTGAQPLSLIAWY